MKRIAISVGDLNGVGIEIALASHKEIAKICKPIYCINEKLLSQATKLLNQEVPQDFILHSVEGDFNIEVGTVSKESGLYSYNSFLTAIHLCETKKTDAIVTMPIHKEAWMLAGLNFKGHTDLLRQHFQQDAIMMLGCEKMFVALYTEHIPLKDISATIQKKRLIQFFIV